MRCNNCGWENPNENQFCEKCDAPLQSGVSSGFNTKSTIREDQPFEKTIPGTLVDPIDTPTSSPVGGKECPIIHDLGGTINPYAGMGAYVPIPRCVLKPVIFPGEDPRYAPQAVQIKGNYTELNRQTVDPDNNTITSKVQATLTCKDGKWYLQNQSAQKTTYVYAGEPIEIKPGDVILMGNRAFIFDQD